MGLFDEILAKAAETDREVLTRYPELKGAVEQYEALKPKAEHDDAVARAWENWRREHWDEERRMPKASVAAIGEAETLRAQLAEAQSRGDAEMTFEEILAGLKGKFATQEDITKVVTDRGFVDARTLDGRIEQMDSGMSYVYGATAHLPVSHKDEFGSVLKLNDLFDYMGKNKLADPIVAYDRMVEPQRQEKLKAEATARAAEVEKLKADHLAEVEKIKAEAAEQMKQLGTMPMSPVESGVGHAGIRLAKPNFESKPDGPQIPADAVLGRGEIAAAVAKQYRIDKGLPLLN